jgi:nicotinamidase-related amidase
MMTHMCVDATVRAAADLGFEVILVADACATRDLEFEGVHVPAAQVQAAFLSALKSYASVLTLEQVISRLGGEQTF